MPPRSSPIDLNDPVERHLSREFTTLLADQTVGAALASLRDRQVPGRIIYFYAVDADGVLQGVVPTRRLLLSPLETPLPEIMVRQVIAIPNHATVLEACEFFMVHRLLAFPVVDASRKLMGVVDVDLYTEEMLDVESSERQEDLFQLVGVHLAESQQGKPLTAFRQRFPWLMCNVVGGIAAAFLSGMFEAELQKVVALALFIPVVLALAESVSIQSVSLALETLRGRSPTWGLLFFRLTREVITGLLLGTAGGLLVALVAWFWLRQTSVAFCLAVGIAGGMTCAASVGLALPFLLRLLRRDPQLAAGPMALAAADMATLLIYFNLARWLFG